MPTKWLSSLLILGLLLIGGALFFFRSPPAGTVLPTATPAVTSAASVAPVDAAAFKAAPPMKRVMELYQSESRRIGRVDPDPKATQKRLEVSARELSDEELRWLEVQGMDAKADADSRFFAVYLLGLSGKEAAIGSLTKIALLPVPDLKNERLREQEVAHRANAVEGLCAGDNCKFEAARNGLLDVVSQQSEDFLRDRAHRCLYMCQTGKPVPEQDTEALKKVRDGGK